MISVNGVVTSWKDESMQNLLDASIEAIFDFLKRPHSNKYCECEECLEYDFGCHDRHTLYSEKFHCEIRILQSVGYTDNEELANFALDKGFWIETHQENIMMGKNKIYFGHPHDSSISPSPNAYHKIYQPLIKKK